MKKAIQWSWKLIAILELLPLVILKLEKVENELPIFELTIKKSYNGVDN